MTKTTFSVFEEGARVENSTEPPEIAGVSAVFA
jgi:hypothetical protein